jgi:glycosyltransferase involved in cell wall biosynthesis
MRKASENTPQLSVVIPTYGRAETLRDVLRHLDRQTLDAGAFEVIALSDHSPDHTAEVCGEMAESVSFPLRFLENERNQGPGHTLNRGIREARAEVVLLMADDILQSPGSLQAHLGFHVRDSRPEAAALGRIIQSPALFHISVFLRHWNPFRFDELEGNRIIPAYRFGAANLSFKRAFMMEHGMFREDLSQYGAAANEDLEVGYRLKKHGLELHYLHDAWAHHFHVYTLDQAVARWYERGLNFAGFRKAATDPELTVYFHDLRWKTAREYAEVLRGPNPFRGRERSFVWHVFREAFRRLTLNRVTERFVWRPMLDSAEEWPWLAERMNAQIYRAYLYFQFLRGIQDAGGRRLPPALSPTAVGTIPKGSTPAN